VVLKGKGAVLDLHWPGCPCDLPRCVFMRSVDADVDASLAA
jgi:hypothetical protein